MELAGHRSWIGEKDFLALKRGSLGIVRKTKMVAPGTQEVIQVKGFVKVNHFALDQACYQTGNVVYYYLFYREAGCFYSDYIRFWLNPSL